MITNNDLFIENISYTNKDFGSIYKELLDLIKNMTNRWDPEQANESDVGIVLVKLMAFLGDKLNYNIDKNILEAFITSATQESSVRKLTEMLGYNMHYYRSATTKVGFRYTGSLGSTEEADAGTVAALSSFKLNAFDTSFKTDDDVIYTLLEDIEVLKGNTVITNKLAMQGELKQLSVIGNNSNDSTLIQLINLDDNNRLYFPDSDVAENGIFINKEVYNSVYNSDVWRRVDNLYDQELGEKIFKFGYDSSKGFPYIEFPEDISDLIGEGIEVYYLVTKGSYGNVNANSLSGISTCKITSSESSTEISSLDESIYSLSNTLSVSGKDKESIDEAYDNFKKTVNTFNTLVSCKDYSNYINRYINDEDNSTLVSNCVITDVRTDPYYSKEIFTRDSNGNSYYDYIISDNIPDTDYYNIIAHGSTPIDQTISSLNLYNKTYAALNTTALNNIATEIESVKTINHSLVLPAADTLNFIEASHKLNCNISTTSKLNNSEQSEVISNIQKALYSNFNAKKLEFGESIPFDSLLNVIKEADTRIKNVSLDEPEIVYYINNASGSKTIRAAYDINTNIDLIINNILAGRLPIFYENSEIAYDYNMDLSKDSFTKNEYNLGIYGTFTVNENNYKLKENEQINILRDSYISNLTYPAYVYYAFYDTESTAGQVIVKKNETYKLKKNQTLYIQYTDSDDNVQFKKYSEGQFIKPNFDLVNTQKLAVIDSSTSSVQNNYASKFVYWDTKSVNTKLTYKLYEKLSDEEKAKITPLYSLGTNEQIDMVSRNSVTLSKETPIFWYVLPRLDENGKIINQKGDLIFKQSDYDSSKYYYILEANEYFVYSNAEKTSLNILGEGTKIEYSSPIIYKSIDNVIDVNDLVTLLSKEDILSFKNTYNWESLDKDLSIVETVSTDYYKDSIINSFSTKSGSVTKDWDQLRSITIDNEKITVNKDTEPIVRSILNFNISSSNPQSVLENQVIYLFTANKIKDEEDSTAVISKKKLEVGSYIQTSSIISIYNDLGLLASLQYQDDGTKLIPVYSKSDDYMYEYDLVRLFNYKKVSITSYTNSLQDFILWLKNNNIISSLNTRGEYVISYEYVKKYFDDVLKDSSYILKFNLNIEDLYISIFDSILLETLLLSIGDSLNLSYIKTAESSGNLYISEIKNLKIYDYLNDIKEVVLKRIKDYKQFDILGDLNENKYITSYTPLYSFLDYNNIYNKLTISKIDFTNSSFNIVGGTKIW